MSKKGPLYQRLVRLRAVQAHSSEKWDEAEALAHSLDEILVSLSKLAPMCRSLTDLSTSDEKAAEVLHEISEELGHVAYHLNDSKFLRLVSDRHRDAPSGADV